VNIIPNYSDANYFQIHFFQKNNSLICAIRNASNLTNKRFIEKKINVFQ